MFHHGHRPKQFFERRGDKMSGAKEWKKSFCFTQNNINQRIVLIVMSSKDQRIDYKINGKPLKLIISSKKKDSMTKGKIKYYPLIHKGTDGTFHLDQPTSQGSTPGYNKNSINHAATWPIPENTVTVLHAPGHKRSNSKDAVVALNNNQKRTKITESYNKNRNYIVVTSNKNVELNVAFLNCNKNDVLYVSKKKRDKSCL